MSVKMMTAVWDAETCLTPCQKLVLLKLADCASDDGVCWPSQSNIARQCEVSRVTVNRCIKRLEKLRYIKARRKRSKGYCVKVYVINIDALIPM